MTFLIKLARWTVLAVAFGVPLAQAANVAEKKPVVQVGIVLFDGVQIIDFAAPYEVFGHAGFGVVTVSKDGLPVTTAMGLKVTPDHAFANAPAFDVLMVPGGEVQQASQDKAILDFVRERSAASRSVFSICTGSFILGASGVLDGLQATTFHRALASMEKSYPKVKVIRDVRWADNGKIVTSAGLSSGIDAALHVVAKLRGADAASTAAMQLEYDWKPEGGFVRTRMADRHMPAIKPDANWPADMKADKLSGLGDTAQWLDRFSVTTAMAPDALLKVIAGNIEALGGWTRQASADGQVWARESEGKRVRLTVATAPIGKDNFELRMAIAVQ